MCVLSSGGISEPRRWVCADAAGRQEAGAFCTTLDPTGSCKSGYCGGTNVCENACGRDADCGDEACGYGIVSSLGLLPLAPALVSACEPRANLQSNDKLCCDNSDCGKGLCAPKSLESGLWVMACRAAP